MTQFLPSLSNVHEAIVSCERCPRLREYCQRIGREKRRAFRDDTYWARPVPGFGDPRARLLIVGLAPAAHGANRTGRVFTGDGAGGSGDFLMSALHRAGFSNLPTSHHAGDGLNLADAFIAAAVRCRAADNKTTPARSRLPRASSAEIDALGGVRVVVALGRMFSTLSSNVKASRPGTAPAAAVRPRLRSLSAERADIDRVLSPQPAEHQTLASDLPHDGRCVWSRKPDATVSVGNPKSETKSETSALRT